MYTKYYQLQHEPFSLTPDPRFVYLTESHREALNHLRYGIEHRKGFICLTGEVGTGKTTLCRTLLEDLGTDVRTALVLNPVLTPTQLVRSIVEEFGIETQKQDRLGYLNLLNDYLLEVDAAGGNAVVIIDETQAMPTETLEMTRLLGNLETATRKLLQIVLVGQPELRERLAQPSLRQLAQRITVRYHLKPMTVSETDGYIRHRLRIAGSDGSALRFDSAAVVAVHRHSGGTPRLVNAISDKTLLAGYVHSSHKINKRLVKLAIRELRKAG